MPMGINGLVSKGNDSDVHITYYEDGGEETAFFCEQCALKTNNHKDRPMFSGAIMIHTPEEIIGHLVKHMLAGDKVPPKILIDLIALDSGVGHIVTQRSDVVHEIPNYYPQHVAIM